LSCPSSIEEGYFFIFMSWTERKERGRVFIFTNFTSPATPGGSGSASMVYDAQAPLGIKLVGQASCSLEGFDQMNFIEFTLYQSSDGK
jgi:hypothetical protein